MAPLFEAQLDLKAPDLVFTPPMDIRVGESFFELVEDLINYVFRISSLVPRVALHGTFTYYQVIYQSFFSFSLSKNATCPINLCTQADMEDMADLADMRQLLMGHVKEVIATCCQFQNFLESYLEYVDDRKGVSEALPAIWSWQPKDRRLQ